MIENVTSTGIRVRVRVGMGLPRVHVGHRGHDISILSSQCPGPSNLSVGARVSSGGRGRGRGRATATATRRERGRGRANNRARISARVRFI